MKASFCCNDECANIAHYLTPNASENNVIHTLMHIVKISPCMSQKQPRFGDDVGVHDFMKFAKKYHQQQEEECASVGRITVCATSPPLVQTLAEYCRKITWLVTCTRLQITGHSIGVNWRCKGCSALGPETIHFHTLSLVSASVLVHLSSAMLSFLVSALCYLFWTCPLCI